jgi:dTDP-4-dehydrorhamnose reductase
LDRLCALAGARLVHVSTDCVFAGTRGHYREDDIADASDLYGRSKLLGEVVNSQHAITLRTSTIGHELNSQYGLLEWFLAQSEDCRGFARAFFSGLPTVELARVVRDIILERPDLHGLYHVGAASISKFDLLTLIAQIYGKKIRIMKDDAFVIDRSLNSQRFTAATGYQAASWPEFVAQMKVGQ